MTRSTRIHLAGAASCVVLWSAAHGLLAQHARGACRVLSATKSVQLTKYVQSKFKLRLPPSMKIEGSDSDCYYRLKFALVESRSTFSQTLFLNPEQTRLFTTMFDVRIDPEAEERREAASRRQSLRAGAKALFGRDGAEVEVVIFSDFQCPYCARLWSTLKQLDPSMYNRLTLYYRAFPLESIHPWAHTADVLASCAQEQGRPYLVVLADLFFSEQRRLTPSTISETAVARLKRERGFDARAFSGCLRAKTGERRVAADLESGFEMGVKAVPTMFINGRRVNGSLGIEQLRAILLQALAESSNKGKTGD